MILRANQQTQNDAVRALAKAGKRRIASVMSTGSGKSIMMGELAVSAIAKCKRVIIVLPRRSLVLQLSKSFSDWGINHGILMQGHRRFSLPMCQIVSIDTYMSRIANGRMELIAADLLIIDELHLQFTPKKLEVFAKYPMVVGFTATPVAPKKQALGLFYDAIVETISMQELMDQGYLAPLKYYAKEGIDLSGVKTGADGDWHESQLEEAMDKPKLVGDIYQNWQRLAAGKRTVIFASSQAHARHLCDEFNGHGWRFEYVDCTTPDEQRNAVFARVKSGSTTGICNVGIVSVGIDIPALECVVLARPTRMVSVYLQCVGRVTRMSPGKTHGIVIDHAGIIERLGLPTDNFEWSLDGKDTVEERLQRKKEEAKAPKDIICCQCSYVFRMRRSCPACGFESIPKGEAIPVYQAELQEVIRPKPVDKESWYAQLKYISRSKGYKDGFADYAFKDKFGHFPHKKHAVQPLPPTPEVLGFFQHRLIKRLKGAMA
jgi:DNA repair protein RadD